MIWQVENFTKPEKLALIKSGDTCMDCNFKQQVEDTEILIGLTGLRILGGAIINAIFPANTKIGGIYHGTLPNIAKNEYDEEGKFVQNKGKRDIPKKDIMDKKQRKALFDDFKRLPKSKQNLDILKECKGELSKVSEVSK